MAWSVWSVAGYLPTTTLSWLPALHCNTFNTLRPKQNGCHFTEDTFKCIFLNENVWMSIQISLKFILKGPINNIPSLVQITAWGQQGDKPLSEHMMVRLQTHMIYVSLGLNDLSYIIHYNTWGGNASDMFAFTKQTSPHHLTLTTYQM